MTTATPYVCLTKQIIQKEKILFLLHHIHGTFNFREYLFMFHHIHVAFKFREFHAAVSNSSIKTADVSLKISLAPYQCVLSSLQMN